MAKSMARAGGATWSWHGVRKGRRSAVLGALLFALVACGGPADPNPPDPTPEVAPRVTIISPVSGSSVSGAVYFAVQLLDPEDLRTLRLQVADDVVEARFPGESPVRVFLIPRDHPEGPLTLRASVGTGTNRFDAVATVHVVYQPPGDVTVGANGGLLGGAEASGAISTVVVPPGTAQGASVQFETMTQAQVLAATGVDYEAVGVTFLGAQEIRSTVPTGDLVAMTSGGFGPMVQTSQAVVSYRILPDAGRGVGELMVINGAAVAPNGDIVSNPVLRPLAGDVVSTGASGVTSTAVRLQGTALPAGPPGTRLRFFVSGLNIYAPYGYLVRFRGAGQVVDVPATVGLNSNGGQYLLSYVPPLSTGAKTVELVQVVGDRVFGSYTMTVTTAPTVSDAKARVDAALAGLVAELGAADSDMKALGMTLDFGPLLQEVAAVRTYWAGRPASDPELVALARMLVAGGVATSAVPASVGPSQTSAACLLAGRKFTFDQAFSARAFNGDRFETGLRGLQAELTLGFLDRFADRLEGSDYDCDPYKDIMCDEYDLCGSGEVLDDPNDPAPRPPPGAPGVGPASWTTGMGSIVLPDGGPLAGSAGGGSGGSPLAAAGAVGVRSMPTFPVGRYTVRGVVNGQPWPFATTVGVDGYFFLPATPAAGATLQLVVRDMVELRECVVPIVGRPGGLHTAIYLDLPSCLGAPIDPDDFTIVWVGGSGRSWSTEANWSPARVPTVDDDVLIPSVADIVEVYAAPVSVRSLTSAGTLRLGNHALVASGDIDLNVFTIQGASATWSAGGSFTVDTWSVPIAYTLPSGVTSMRRLVLGGLLTVPHTLTVTDGVDVRNGGFRGAGTVVLPVGSVSTQLNTILSTTLRDTVRLQLDGRLTVQTTAQLSDTPTIAVGTTGELVFERAAGMAEALVAGLWNQNQTAVGTAGTGASLVNDGLIRVVDADASNLYRLGVRSFTNRGVVAVPAGTRLAFGNAGGGTGQVSTSVLNQGRIEGAGSVAWTHLTANIGYTFTHAANATLDVGSLSLSAHGGGTNLVLTGPISTSRLDVVNGLVVLTASLALTDLQVGPLSGATDARLSVPDGSVVTVAGSAFVNGNLTGSGRTTLGPAAAMTGPFRLSLTGGHDLESFGTVTWTSGALTPQLSAAAGSEFQNRGSFLVQHNTAATGAGIFRNFGALRKQAAGTATWTLCYVEEAGGQLVEDEGSLVTSGC